MVLHSGIKLAPTLSFEQSVNEILQLSCTCPYYSVFPAPINMSFLSPVDKQSMNGSNIIFPFDMCSSVFFDFFEVLCAYMLRSQQQCPIYILSEGNIGMTLRSYFNVQSEWLQESIQAKCLETSDIPLVNSEAYEKAGLLHFCGHVDQFVALYQQHLACRAATASAPCGVYMFVHNPEIVFEGNCFMEYFLSSWKDLNQNIMILTDCQVNHSELIAPYRPFKMKVASYPLNPFLQSSDQRMVLGAYGPPSTWIRFPPNDDDEQRVDPSIVHDSDVTPFTDEITCLPENKSLSYPGKIRAEALSSMEVKAEHFFTDVNGKQLLAIKNLPLHIYDYNNELFVNIN